MQVIRLTRWMARQAHTGFLLLLLLWTRPLPATDIHSYRPDEYAVVTGGRSPDGRWSVAAHGGGPDGYDDFDLYLMREPAHKKLSRLRLRDCLDTGPVSIVAIWAPDSLHVALLHRTDRHVLDLRLFGVADGRLRSIKVPRMVDVVGQQYLQPGVSYEVGSRLYRVTWPQPSRLSVREWDSLDAAKTVFRRGMEAYLTVDRLGPSRTFTQFSAQAVGEFAGHGELRLSSVRPLPLSKWPKTIVYSPHLRRDPERGLFSILPPMPGSR